MKTQARKTTVRELAIESASAELKAAAATAASVNDNAADELSDPLFMIMARREIAATRLW